MNIKIIQELAKIMSEHKLSKIDIDDDGTHILLEASNGTAVNQVNASQTMPNEVINSTSAPEQKSAVSKASNVYEQKSQIVGTLYLAPDSTSKPFVTVGSKVKKGDTICIIESMKILNDIPAEADGTIMEICASNEQIVDFGKKLFVIEL